MTSKNANRDCTLWLPHITGVIADPAATPTPTTLSLPHQVESYLRLACRVAHVSLSPRDPRRGTLSSTDGTTYVVDFPIPSARRTPVNIASNDLNSVGAEVDAAAVVGEEPPRGDEKIAGGALTGGVGIKEGGSASANDACKGGSPDDGAETAAAVVSAGGDTGDPQKGLDAEVGAVVPGREEGCRTGGASPQSARAAGGGEEKGAEEGTFDGVAGKPASGLRAASQGKDERKETETGSVATRGQSLVVDGVGVSEDKRKVDGDRENEGANDTGMVDGDGDGDDDCVDRGGRVGSGERTREDESMEVDGDPQAAAVAARVEGGVEVGDDGGGTRARVVIVDVLGGEIENITGSDPTTSAGACAKEEGAGTEAGETSGEKIGPERQAPAARCVGGDGVDRGVVIESQPRNDGVSSGGAVSGREAETRDAPRREVETTGGKGPADISISDNTDRDSIRDEADSVGHVLCQGKGARAEEAGAGGVEGSCEDRSSFNARSGFRINSSNSSINRGVVPCAEFRKIWDPVLQLELFAPPAVDSAFSATAAASASGVSSIPDSGSDCSGYTGNDHASGKGQADADEEAGTGGETGLAAGDGASSTCSASSFGGVAASIGNSSGSTSSNSNGNGRPSSRGAVQPGRAVWCHDGETVLLLSHEGEVGDFGWCE